MKPKPEEAKPERERKDWLVVLLILLLGFLCVIVAGQRALLFSPTWTLDADMESKLNPNTDFLTKPIGFVEPVDAAILTQPAWVQVFLTPGASFVTGTAPPAAAAGDVTAVGTTAVPTNTIPVFTDTAVPTNTFIWLPLPATNTPKPGGGEPANTATNTPVPSADLWITNDDGQSMYAPGDTLNYVVTVTNDGPAAVDGAIVTNTFTGGVISTIDWNCAGAACPTAAGSGDINEVLNNLPSSDTVTYTIAVVLFNTTGGNVASAASVSLPGGYTDPGPLPNSANDSDAPLVGTTGPDCSGPMDPDCLYDLPAPNSLTIYVSIVADGDVGTWDLVYYERPHTAPAGIYLDVVRIEISDGTNTYTVFEWGDGNPNPNTNIASVPVPPEDDNTFIGAGSLYNGSGVAIDIDHPALGIPSGTTYTQIIITALDGGPPDDGNCGIDGIEVLP